MTLIQPKGRFTGHEVIDAQRDHLEPDELVRLFNHLKDDPFWYGYFRLQHYYGCRVSEVSIVLKEDVSWSDGMILIRRLKKRGEEGFRPYVYGMPKSLSRVLRRVPQHEQSPWFFASPRADARGEPMPQDRLGQLRRTGKSGRWRAVHRSTADRKFRAACEAVGLPMNLAHTHVLRHTRATLMLAEGAKIEDLQHLLGHIDPKTTQLYLGFAQSMRLRLNATAALGLGELGDA